MIDLKWHFLLELCAIVGIVKLENSKFENQITVDVIHLTQSYINLNVYSLSI